MAFPRRLLGDDEDVVFDLHPHPKTLVVPFVLVPVVVGLASYGITAMPAGQWQAAGRWAVLAAALLVLLVWALRPYLRWQSTRYVLTTRRVIVRTGVLARRGRDIPLSRVTDVAFEHGLLERLLGCGTLVVESGGERGQLVLPAVPDVEQVQRELYELADAGEPWRGREDETP